MQEPLSSRYPPVGEVIDGKYRIERMLGEGGMGAVMGAYHMFLRAPVALKFISPDMLSVPGAVERFLNEGVAARGIHSDHIVRIDDVGRLPSGLPFIVMEMLSGSDLSELLEREGTPGLPVPRAVHFVLQILRGLHVAHNGGIIHRDLKPSNAFVITRDGEPDFVKLLDFGISKITSEQPGAQHLTQTNTGLGTPLYMSPEQARNARDAAAQSDLYSVSAILFELLTGRTPYQAETPNDLLYKLFTTEPDPILSLRPDLPPGLAEVIHRGLSREPANRPASAAAYAELLAPFADERSIEVLSRLRASIVPGSALAAGAAARSQHRPSVASALDRTALAPATTSARDTATPTVADAQPAPAKKTTFIALGAVLLLAVGAGAAVVATRGGETSQNGAGASALIQPPPAATSAEKTAQDPPHAEHAEPAEPQVTPVAASAEEPAPQASAAAPAATQISGPLKGASKVAPSQNRAPKNPFSVGIVQ